MIGVGTFKIRDNARKYVNEVLDSERLSYGPFTQKFERVFAASHDCRFAVMTASGTCALMIALAALKNRYKWQDGDEVIVPAVTFIATSNVVLQLGLKPVFVDVEPVFYEIDATKIEAAITPRTRCIIPVHLFGCPCDMDPIMEIARRRGLRVIEDSCETMFTRYKGRSVGAFGDIGCFSTYVAHLLTTGVGGLCTTNDPDLAVQVRSLMNHGRDSIYLSIDDDKDKTKDERELIIQRRFSFVQMGYSFRVTEMEGALGLAEFECRDEMMARRLENGLYFNEALKKHEGLMQLPRLRPEAGHAFMMYPVVVRDAAKTELVNYLEANGIETREMLPLINQPYYKEIFNLSEDDYPVAKWINRSGFYIASHQDLTDAEREHIVGTFSEYFAGQRIKKERSCLVALSRGDTRAAESLLDVLPSAAFDERILVEASSDESVPALYGKAGFKVLRGSGGKGDSLKRALEATDCDNVVVIGLDGSNDPKDIMGILARLKQGSELVIASRFMPGGGRRTARPLGYRSLGNRLFTFALSVIFSSNVTDCNNLFRGFKQSAWRRLNLSEDGESAMFEMTLMALEKNLKFVEVPTVERAALVAHHKRNRVWSALSFCWILTKYVFNPSTTGKWREKAANR